MKHLFILLVAGIAQFASSQNHREFIIGKEYPISSNAQVEFSFIAGECDVQPDGLPFKYGFLKIKNLTSRELELGMNIVVEYEEGCVGCDGSDESRFYISLKPNEVFTSRCKAGNRSLIMVNNPNFSGGWKFKEIRVENLYVK